MELLKFIGFMFIACTFIPLPADTYLLYSTKYFSPLFLGVVGGLINALAVLCEKFFIKLVLKAKKFENLVVFFNESSFTKLFQKNLFLSLVISAFSFIPFEPFRLIAITKNYNNAKYFLATFIGRGFRYFLLALLGKELLKYDWIGVAITASLIIFFYGAYKSYIKNKKKKHL